MEKAVLASFLIAPAVSACWMSTSCTHGPGLRDASEVENRRRASGPPSTPIYTLSGNGSSDGAAEC
eukprot:889454-Pyramimonas_sp.AAC.1